MQWNTYHIIYNVFTSNLQYAYTCNNLYFHLKRDNAKDHDALLPLL